MPTQTLEPSDEWQELDKRPVLFIEAGLGCEVEIGEKGVGRVLAREGAVVTYDVGRDPLSDLMDAWFGESEDNWGPISFLLGEGWSKDKGVLTKAGVNHMEDIEYKERKCVEFLCEQWDMEWKPGGEPVRR